MIIGLKKTGLYKLMTQKNDVIFIVKLLYRATSRRFVALLKFDNEIITSFMFVFICYKCNIGSFSNKCRIF